VLPPPGLSGGIRVIAIHAEELARRGHRVVLVSAAKRPPALRSRVRSLIAGRGWPRAGGLGPSHLDDRILDHRHLAERYRVTNADVPDADVVIATWWETAEWVARFSPAKGAKAYFIQHYEAFQYMPKHRVDATWRLPMHKITISRWLVELARHRFDDYDVSLVKNGVDLEQFRAPPRGKQSVPTVGLMYSTIPWKGLDTSLRALELVRRRFPNLALRAFGAEPLDPRLPLPDNAVYTECPPQAELPDIYASCDVWLCGSRTEGFGLPTLEAMACRCPVVSTRVGGSMDILRSGQNGYLVPIDDVPALADGLSAVLSLPDARWRALSDAAYETALEHDWQTATDRFEAALHRAIERQWRSVAAPLRALSGLRLL